MLTYSQKMHNAANARNQFTHNSVYVIFQKRILTLVDHTIYRMMTHNEFRNSQISILPSLFWMRNVC